MVCLGDIRVNTLYKGDKDKDNNNHNNILIKDQALIQWVQGALFPRIKRPEREAEHSPHQVPKLSVHVSVAPLPMRNFLACAADTLRLPFLNRGRCRTIGPKSGCSDWLCRGVFQCL